MFQPRWKNNNQEVVTTSRRRFIKRGGIATGLAMLASTFSLVPFSPAHAAAATTPSDIQVNSVEQSEAALYLQQVVNSQDYQRFVRQVKLNYTGILSIREQDSLIQHSTDKQSSLITVRIPLSGGTGHSFYVAVFIMGSRSIIQTYNALFTKTPEKNIAISAQLNGQQLIDATITTQGEFVSGNASVGATKAVELSGLSAQKMYTLVKSSPEAAQAISGQYCCALNGFLLFGVIDIPVALVLILLCAGSCVVTLGGTCFLCLTGAGVIGGAEVGYILGACNNNPTTFLDALYFYCNE
jgi:hypothetical protein